MSNQYYNLKWQEAVGDLMEQVIQENAPLEQNEEKYGLTYKRSDKEWFHHFAELYIKYIDSYKKLEDCYDQLVHPQKRILLKETLENTMVRMVEIKHELIKYNTESDHVRSDFVNLDEILMELKKTPESLDIPVPRYFKSDFNQSREERNQLVDKLLMQFHDSCEPEEEVLEDRSMLETNIEYAIRIIQKNERGRQGIERAHLYKLAIKDKAKKLDRTKKLISGNDKQEETEREENILIIQKYYRGFKARETVDQIRNQELEFLGMKKPDLVSQDTLDERKKHEQQRKKMKMIQQENEQEYKQSLVDQLALVKKNEGPDIKERMLQERRKWIQDFMEMTDYSAVPVNPEEFYEKDAVMPPLTPEEEEARKAEQDAKDNKKKGDKGGKKGKGKNKTEADEFMEGRLVAGPSEIVFQIQKNIEKYTKEWDLKDESKNFVQKHDIELVKQIARPQVEDNMKVLVDEMIGIELDNLRLERGIKKKKAKKSKKKGKKAKKKKIPGQNLVKNRDPRDMLAELIEAQIVKKLLPSRISDFKGDHNLLGTLQEKQETLMPDPSMAQLRQLVTEMIAIPLGSKECKSKLQNLIWFLFYGPMGTGKSMMVRSLQTECDALVIDISPSNLEGKYQDKSGTLKMLYMCFTVAKEYQPAIIISDEFEQLFVGGKKKVTKGPARLKKPLQDMKKSKYIEPSDQVAFIAMTNKPADQHAKDSKSFFDKKFYFPFPNYATRKFLFQNFVEQKGLILSPNFQLSSIAHITEGFTAGSFKIVIDKVVTQRRILRLQERPLTVNEFITPLSGVYSTYAQEYEKIKAFTDEVTGLKERREKKNNRDGDEAAPPKKKGK